MHWFVVGVLALAGCDRVFSFGERPPRPPGSVDGGPQPPPTCLAPGDIVELPLIADTYLSPNDGPHGGESIARVGNGSVLLARFDRGNVSFNVFELTLNHPGMAVGCGSGDGCAPCALGATGSMGVYVTRPDWDEATATHAVRTTGAAWAGPGATGGDRSVLLSTAAYGGADLDASAFTNSPTIAAEWLTSLSILITAETPNVTAVFGTREGADECGRAQPPTVKVTCTAASTCGNDTVEPPEDCDDGNRVGGDGCSEACRFEGCGNGRLDVGEDCDDSNTAPGDGCDAACQCEGTC